MRTDPAERYRRALGSQDPAVREMAARQLARLGKRPAGPSSGRPSPWAHVPLADVFAEAGNRLHSRPQGTIETGHEPIHGSRSGRCVVISVDQGRWWCQSCRRSGDAAAYLADVLGCSYAEAAARLAERFGAPTGRRAWRRRALEA